MSAPDHFGSLARIEWPPDDGPPPLGPDAAALPGYRVIAHMRRGNDLDVYDAWSDERVSRCVLKLPRADRLEDARVVERLVAEGRLLLSLSHPHIVRAYEVVKAPVPGLVLETLPGETLSRLIADSREADEGLQAAELAHLGLHVGSAVAYLHSRNVLHLDLKPSNVIAEGSRAKLLDLSLARAPGPAPVGVGTWCYLAPEQARGESLTPAADVWGLGATLYEAAIGSAPFDEPGDSDEFPQLRRRARRIDGPRPELGELARLVAGCLEPDPAHRLTLAELMGALEALAGMPEAERR